ncbi:MAG: hypothetical protein LBE37_02950 [Sphingobacterium sp.]|nr:hypothetical protein [Sphingobacterium sp.]
MDETFSTLSGEEIPNVYQLIVEKANDELEPYDAKVSKTIEDIIEKFFGRIENSLIYICSDDNQKSKQRHDIFDRWYNKSIYKENILKLDNIIHIDIGMPHPQTLYTSMMFHKDNLNSKKLISIYKQIENALNEDK